MEKTNERNAMLFTRVSPEDKQEAQEVADERYDGNLSMLVRIAVKDFVRSVKTETPSRKREVAA